MTRKPEVVGKNGRNIQNMPSAESFRPEAYMVVDQPMTLGRIVRYTLFIWFLTGVMFISSAVLANKNAFAFFGLMGVGFIIVLIIAYKIWFDMHKPTEVRVQ